MKATILDRARALEFTAPRDSSDKELRTFAFPVSGDEDPKSWYNITPDDIVSTGEAEGETTVAIADFTKLENPGLYHVMIHDGELALSVISMFVTGPDGQTDTQYADTDQLEDLLFPEG